MLASKQVETLPSPFGPVPYARTRAMSGIFLLMKLLVCLFFLLSSENIPGTMIKAPTDNWHPAPHRERGPEGR